MKIFIKFFLGFLLYFYLEFLFRLCFIGLNMGVRMVKKIDIILFLFEVWEEIG